MSIANKTQPFNSDEVKVQEKKAEIKILSDKLDNYNKMLEEISPVEKELEGKAEEVTALKAILSGLKKEHLEKVHNYIKVIEEKDIELQSKIKEAKIITDRIRNQEDSLFLAKKLLSDVDKKIENKNNKLTELNKELNKRLSAIEKTLLDIKKVDKQIDDRLIMEKEVKSNILIAEEKLSKVKAAHNAKISSFNKTVVAKRKEREDISKDNESKRKDLIIIKKEIEEAIKIRDSKLKEFSDKTLTLEQSFGELSMRETKLKSTKEYLAKVIKSLSLIDPKKLSKIDLSKI